MISRRRASLAWPSTAFSSVACLMPTSTAAVTVSTCARVKVSDLDGSAAALVGTAGIAGVAPAVPVVPRILARSAALRFSVTLSVLAAFVAGAVAFSAETVPASTRPAPSV